MFVIIFDGSGAGRLGGTEMFDFEFHNPVRIVFGRGREKEIGRLLAADGIGRVLLVTGMGSVGRSGLYDRVTASLVASGVDFTDYSGVAANPVLSHVVTGIARARKDKVEAVLAVGGGSVIDEAKTIAAGIFHDGEVWDFFIGRDEIKKALPVYTILTLAATGSEMNRNAVITNTDTRQKYSISSDHLYPRLSILNPELTFTVPPDHSVYGAVDAIAHVIEAYFTKEPGTRLQDRLVESIILTVMESVETVLETPEDYDARATFMWAATLALNGLTPAGVGPYAFPNHMIEHALSAIYNIPHGAGLAVVIPAWMKWHAPRNREQHERFARKIFGRRTAEEGITALEDWLKKIGAPVRLKEVGIPASSIPEIAANAAGLAKVWGIEEPYCARVIEGILINAV